MSISSLLQLAHIPPHDIDSSIFSTLWHLCVQKAHESDLLVSDTDDRSKAVSICISLIRACKTPVSVDSIKTHIKQLQSVYMYGAPLLSYAHYLIKPHIGVECDSYKLDSNQLILHISDSRSVRGLPIGANEHLFPRMLQMKSHLSPSLDFTTALVMRIDLYRLYAIIMPEGARIVTPPDYTLSNLRSQVCCYAGIRLDPTGKFSYRNPPKATPRLLLSAISAVLEHRETPMQRMCVAELILVFLCASRTVPLSISHVIAAQRAHAYLRALAIRYAIRVLRDTDICVESKTLHVFPPEQGELPIAYPPATLVQTQRTLEMNNERMDLHTFIIQHEPVRSFLIQVAREIHMDT